MLVSKVRLFLISALVSGLAVFGAACKNLKLTGWSTETPWTHVIVERAEDYRFKGRIRDVETNEPIAGATVRLELVPIKGQAGGEVLDYFELSNHDYQQLESEDGCSVIDTLGSTRAYQKVNEIYRNHYQTGDIVERKSVMSDSAGAFSVQSTVLREEMPETGGESEYYGFQRIVVEKDGYRLFSQGVFSKCKGHLQALRPVELIPKSAPE